MKIFNKVILSTLLVLTAASAQADSYQYKMLFNPTEPMLNAETKGRVMIYDRMESEMIDVAMQKQFDRIQNMMFVRTQYKNEEGEPEKESEDCD